MIHLHYNTPLGQDLTQAVRGFERVKKRYGSSMVR